MDVEDEDLLVGIVAAGIAIQELEHGIDMDVAAHAATLSRRTKQLRNRVRPGFCPVAFGANTRARSSVSPSHRGPLSRTPLWR